MYNIGYDKTIDDYIISFIIIYTGMLCLRTADTDDLLRDVVRQYGQARITIPFHGY